MQSYIAHEVYLPLFLGPAQFESLAVQFFVHTQGEPGNKAKVYPASAKYVLNFFNDTGVEKTIQAKI